MKSIDEFLPEILPSVPGCPIPLAYSAIRAAAIEFCQTSRLWRYSTTIACVDGDGDFPVVASAQLFEIESARTASGTLKPVSLSWLNEMIPDWRASVSSTEGNYITQVDIDTIRVVPGMTGNVDVYVWLQPSETAIEVPDFIADKYRRLIAYGAKAELMAIPNQTFTNPAIAAYNSQRFYAMMSTSFTKGVSGQQRAPIRMKGSFF